MTSSSGSQPARSGRRPGLSGTRQAVAAAAITQFADLGYDRATIRGIAREAGVDPALVLRFHGSKEALFRDVMQVPATAAAALEKLAEGPRKDVGRRLAQLAVDLLEAPATRAIIIGRIRSAASHAAAAALVRETVARDIGRLTSVLETDRPEARAVLVGTQIVGLTFARYVVRLEPLASMPPDEIVTLIAPTFQRYLVGPLP